MSKENLTGHEHQEHRESEPSHGEVESRPKDHELSQNKTEQEPIDIELASKRVEEEARSAKETKVEEKPSHQHHPVVISKKLKNSAYKDNLKKARAGLSRPQQVFSKIVHQPVVDRVSEIGAKTVARPTSLLSAGFVALLGSSITLFVAHRYGFRYNLVLFFALFITGYFLGLIFEALRVLVKGPKR